MLDLLYITWYHHVQIVDIGGDYMGDKKFRRPNIPDEVYERLQVVADKRLMSTSSLIVQILLEWLNKNEKRL